MQHLTDCHVDPIAGRASADDRRNAEVQYLAVAGMGCPNCAHRVRNALLRAPGVVDVEVDLPGGLASVWFRGAEIGVSDLVEVVAAVGRETQHTYLAVPVRYPR